MLFLLLDLSDLLLHKNVFTTKTSIFDKNILEMIHGIFIPIYNYPLNSTLLIKIALEQRHHGRESNCPFHIQGS